MSFLPKGLLPSLLTATVLAVLLFPGFLVTLPPLPQDSTHDTIEKRVVRTGVVTKKSVAVHALIFFVVYGLIDYFVLRRLVKA